MLLLAPALLPFRSRERATEREREREGQKERERESELRGAAPHDAGLFGSAALGASTKQGGGAVLLSRGSGGPREITLFTDPAARTRAGTALVLRSFCFVTLPWPRLVAVESAMNADTVVRRTCRQLMYLLGRQLSVQYARRGCAGDWLLQPAHDMRIQDEVDLND